MVLEGLFKKAEKEKPTEGLELRNLEAALQEHELRLLYYKKIIEKYGAMINEYEEKNIPELKSLVNGKENAIQEIKSRMQDELLAKKNNGDIHEFNYETDFPFLAEKIFKYSQNFRHIHANLPVSFWLSSSEILELQAADPFDRALFLCSLLRAFDAKSKVLVVELENNLIHPIVVCEIKGKPHLLDPSQKDAKFDSFSDTEIDSILSTFAFDGNKFLKKAYEFNDEGYTEF
ncbi:hypothetical protein HY989_00990 [Candidatus Micrarchaeota archaeon]|nr:hypothetical protein [Candidatus Micrarchaeota archaeon]